MPWTITIISAELSQHQFPHCSCYQKLCLLPPCKLFSLPTIFNNAPSRSWRFCLGLRYNLITARISQTAWLSISQSDLVSYCAEQLIYSELKEDWSVWVYESDMQTDKMVYRSNMTWPNKQHEDVYICLGMAARETPDTRCLSENMTVVFTEEFSTDHVDTTRGLQIKLPFKMFNHFLTEKDLEIRTNFCDALCVLTSPPIIVDLLFAFLFIGVPLLLLICGLLIVGCIKCCNFIKEKSKNACDPEALSGYSNHGKGFPCLFLPSFYNQAETIWMYQVWDGLDQLGHLQQACHLHIAAKVPEHHMDIATYMSFKMKFPTSRIISDPCKAWSICRHQVNEFTSAVVFMLLIVKCSSIANIQLA